MHSLADLLHPITPDQFRADYEDRKPLHIPASDGHAKAALLDWAGFNDLLNQSALWTAATLKLVINGEPVPPAQYCTEAQTPEGGVVARPVPAKLQPLLAMGASLIANEAQTLTPDLRRLSRALAEAFAGQVGVNLYCSFGGVHAFDTHYDTHHVFAVQVEGHKTWRLYANRAADPVDLPPDAETARRIFSAERGPVLQVVEMSPGDVLYLPRGWYHDASTADGSSLHVTFSITPLHGRVLFRLLESAAMQDPAFRRWLSPAWRDEGRPLAAQLSDLGQRLARLAALPEFADEIAMTQQRLVPPSAELGLPDRIALTRFRLTGLMPPRTAGPAAVVMDWLITQREVVLEDMIAQFDFVPEAAVRHAVEAAERAGALKRL